MPEDKIPTLNGSPTKVSDLNTGSAAPVDQAATGFFARVSRANRNLSLFLAGMYTGVGCSGTPHSHRGSNDKVDQDDPDQPKRSGPV